MSNWNPQQYSYRGRQEGVSSDVLEAAIGAIERIQAVDPRLPTILTLRHLSAVTELPYSYLRNVVCRSSGEYKRVLFKKRQPGRSSRYREIHIPAPMLLELQTWIASYILRVTKPHSASYAYHPRSEPVYAAQQHCGCRWLLKVDIEDFFHTISEDMVYSVFLGLGYNKLFAFELARITTMVSSTSPKLNLTTKKWSAIPNYRHEKVGFLPQGSPTSPMLSNLVMKPLDESFSALARNMGFNYTRYADDLAFSTPENVTKEAVLKLKRKVDCLLKSNGFNINKRKTSIRGPGARRIVLGILVDGPDPKLSKKFKDAIKMHLYFLNSPKHGPSLHAKNRNTSISTLYHHVRGKIAWAEKIEPAFGRECLKEFMSITWPPRDIQ